MKSKFEIDLFTLNRILGGVMGVIAGYLKYGQNASMIAFTAAFGYGLSFLITISVILIFDGRRKLEEFQYLILSGEKFLFSFRSDKYMYMLLFIYMAVFSAMVKGYNPDLTIANTLLFAFIATSFFSATNMIIHANIILLTLAFGCFTVLNIVVTHFGVVEFIRDSQIIIYFPMAFFFVSGYIEEYKRLENKVLLMIFSESDFENLAVSLFKLKKPDAVQMPGLNSMKLIASTALWIIVLSSVELDFSYFHGFLSAIKN